MLPAGGSVQYYVEDFLGSSRIVAQSNGVVCYDGDFTPYGGELPYTNSCLAQNNYKFEGKERDTETQNDDFGARYYSWRFGRWLSADWSAVPVPVPYANLTNPQTLNLYAMVADDPESFADLDGHFGTCGIAAEFGCATSVGDAQSNGVTVGGQADSQVDASQKLTAEKQQKAAQEKAAANLAGIIYNETASLRPAQGTNGKPDQASQTDLHNAREAIGEVVLNIEAAGKTPNVASSVVSKEGKQTAAYADSLAAARDAINAGGDKAGPQHFYLRSGDLTVAKGKVIAGDQPSWARGVVPAGSYGPFRNPVRTGDVATGKNIHVDIYNVP